MEIYGHWRRQKEGCLSFPTPILFLIVSIFLFYCLELLTCCTVVQNNHKSRRKYWTCRSSVCSFTLTAHSFPCSIMLILLACSAALIHSLGAHLLTTELVWMNTELVWMNKCWNIRLFCTMVRWWLTICLGSRGAPSVSWFCPYSPSMEMDDNIFDVNLLFQLLAIMTNIDCTSGRRK